MRREVVHRSQELPFYQHTNGRAQTSKLHIARLGQENVARVHTPVVKIDSNETWTGSN